MKENKNKKIKWYKFASRKMALYRAHLTLKSLLKCFKKYFNFELKNMIIQSNGVEGTIYFDEDEYKKRFCKLVLDYFKESIKKEKNPYSILEEIQNKLIETAKEISNREINDFDDINKAYAEFNEKFDDYQLVVWFPVMCEEIMFPYAQNKLNEITKDKNIWETIIEPIEPSLINREQIDLLKLILNYSEEGLKNHHEKYKWTNIAFIGEEPYPLSYYQKRIEETQDAEEKLKKLQAGYENREKLFFDLLSSFNISKEDKELFLFVNKLNYLRQTRDEGRRQAYYYMTPLFKQMTRKFDCDYETLFSFTHDEILESIKEKAKLSMNKPLEDYILLLKEGKQKVFKNNTKKILRIERILNEKENGIKELKELNGQIANKGVIKGKARILRINHIKEDLNSFQKGEILVSISTKPEYITAMEKAIAFVTDEGGITCHAAIISRELKKPCIVGTKIATKVFKTGDMVEVDADKGIIRKII